MNSLEYFRKLFDYDHWGNRAAFDSLATIPAGNGASGTALKLFGHLVGAGRLWLARFEGVSGTASPWPDLTADECREAIEDLNRRWLALLNGFTVEKLAEELSYRNTKGVEFRTPIEDVLIHLIMHSAYHRGQVARAVREAGGKPAPTDYIGFVRQMKPA